MTALALVKSIIISWLLLGERTTQSSALDPTWMISPDLTSNYLDVIDPAVPNKDVHTSDYLASTA